MNYKMIRFVISWVLKVEGMLMLLPALVGAMYQEKTGFAYLIRYGETAYIFSGTLILNMVSALKMTFLTPMQRARRACWTAGSAP